MTDNSGNSEPNASDSNSQSQLPGNPTVHCNRSDAKSPVCSSLADESQPIEGKVGHRDDEEDQKLPYPEGVFSSECQEIQDDPSRLPIPMGKELPSNEFPAKRKRKIPNPNKKPPSQYLIKVAHENSDPLNEIAERAKKECYLVSTQLAASYDYNPNSSSRIIKEYVLEIMCAGDSAETLMLIINSVLGFWYKITVLTFTNQDSN